MQLEPKIARTRTDKTRVSSTVGDSVPFTYSVDVQHAMDVLDFGDMVTLASLFQEWALSGELDPEQTTKVMLWSVDYEAVAAFVGPGWIAASSEPMMDPLTFIARGARVRSDADDAYPETS